MKENSIEAIRRVARELATFGTLTEHDGYNLESLAAHAATLSAIADTIDTPETADFLLGVEREQIHQRLRWGLDHDAAKSDDDWFWLVAFLATKAKQTESDPTKKCHRLIACAAALANWHAATAGEDEGA